MRILLLIIQYPPDVNSTGLLMAQVCEGLVVRGHDVSVITTFPHYEEFSVWKEYRGRPPRRDRYKGIDVLRLPIWTPGRKQRMLNRLASYLSFNGSAIVANWLSRRSYDVILCTNGSFFTGFSARLGRPRTPFIYNVQDIYPETFVEAGLLRNRPAIAALKRMERYMYRKAAHITVITPSFRDSLVSNGVPEDKVSVIPNFVDVGFIRPLPKDNDFSREHGLADKFVITHAGNVGYAYDLESLIDVAARLNRHDDMVFLIVGDGAAKPGLERKAKAVGAENVRFLPFQSVDRLPWLRASSDVQVSLYKRGAARYSMPSKVYEIMASGRPVLVSADPDSDVWRLILDAECGVCVEPENPGALSDAILTLYRDATLRQTLGERGRSLAERDYSKPAVVAQYDELLRRVAASPVEARSLARQRRA